MSLIADIDLVKSHCDHCGHWLLFHINLWDDMTGLAGEGFDTWTTCDFVEHPSIEESCGCTYQLEQPQVTL